MRLYVGPMDTVLIEVDQDGRVRFEGAPGGTIDEVGHAGTDSDWTVPSLQERRAIIYAAREGIAELTELVDVLERVRT